MAQGTNEQIINGKKCDVFQIDLQLYLLPSCPSDAQRKILKEG